jgi:hypothetical protein
MEKKVCSKCKVDKELCEYQKDSSKKSGYKSQCKKCCYIIQKIYKEKNAILVSKKRKDYYLINIEKEKNKNKLYRELKKTEYLEKQKKKYSNNHIYKIKVNVRRRINKFLKKENKNSFDIIGCTPEQLKVYLENKFRDGMSWDNYGKFGWHIDHIIPLSSGKTKEEIEKLCQYHNLQPLWAKENLKKGNKIL